MWWKAIEVIPIPGRPQKVRYKYASDKRDWDYKDTR